MDQLEKYDEELCGVKSKPPIQPRNTPFSFVPTRSPTWASAEWALWNAEHCFGGKNIDAVRIHNDHE